MYGGVCCAQSFVRFRISNQKNNIHTTHRKMFGLFDRRVFRYMRQMCLLDCHKINIPVYVKAGTLPFNLLFMCTYFEMKIEFVDWRIQSQSR